MANSSATDTKQSSARRKTRSTKPSATLHRRSRRTEVSTPRSQDHTTSNHRERIKQEDMEDASSMRWVEADDLRRVENGVTENIRGVESWRPQTTS